MNQHIKLKRLLSSLLFAVMVFSLVPYTVFAANTAAGSDTEASKVTADVAATIALLFVGSNLDSTEWDMSTDIKDIVEMYDTSENVAAYCIKLYTSAGDAGYVVVSTDTTHPLIQEYSDTAEFLVATEETAGIAYTATEKISEDTHIYYYGPLNYGTEKVETEYSSVAAEDEDYDGTKLVDLVCATGLISFDTGTAVPAGYIEDDSGNGPLNYLKSLYPGTTFTNDSYYNIGDSSIYGYEIDVKNGCVVYGTAAILYYYLSNSYSYNEILAKCKAVAIDNGYATTSDYKIGLTHTEDYVNDCISEFNLSKEANSIAFSWAYGKSEISNNRPILYNIATGSLYQDHAVTAFAWTQFSSVDGVYRFFKIKDGYSTSNRYVHCNDVTGSFITKVV